MHVSYVFGNFKSLIKHGCAHPKEIWNYSGKKNVRKRKGGWGLDGQEGRAEELRPYSAVHGEALGFHGGGHVLREEVKNDVSCTHDMLGGVAGTN